MSIPKEKNGRRMDVQSCVMDGQGQLDLTSLITWCILKVAQSSFNRGVCVCVCVYGLIKEVIYDVSPTNVVQIITNNGLAFVKVEKMLMKKYIGLYMQHIVSIKCLKMLANKKMLYMC